MKPTLSVKIKGDSTSLNQSLKRAQLSLKKMGTSVNGFASNLSKKMSSAVKSSSSSLSQLQKKLKGLGGSLLSVGSKLTKFGAIGGAISTVLSGALIKSTAQAVQEMKNLAVQAGITTQELQKGAFGARSVGVDMAKYADILRDVNDRLGDFEATGAGTMVDFFDNIAPKVGITAEAFKGLNSAQALQLYVSSLEKANLSQADMTFYMEAIASDSTRLLPLLTNNGKAMSQMQQEAEKLGIALGDLEISKTIEANKQINKLGDVIRTKFTKAIAELSPLISVITERFTNWFNDSIGGFGGLSNKVLEFANVIVNAFTSFGNTFGKIGATFQWMKASIQSLIGSALMGVGLLMNTIDTLISSVRGSFNILFSDVDKGFGTKLIDSMKLFASGIADNILKPIQYTLEVLSKLPKRLGGGFSSDALDKIKGYREALKGTRDDLKKTYNLDTEESAMSKTADSLMQKSKEFLDSSIQNYTEGIATFNQPIAMDGVQKFFADLTNEVNARKQELQNSIIGNALQMSGSEEGSQTPTNEDGEEVGLLQNFQNETQQLFELMGIRGEGQAEIRQKQFNEELEQLKQNLDRKKITITEYEQEVADLTKDYEKDKLDAQKRALKDGFVALTSNSSKAQKFMNKLRIAEAIATGTQSAVEAWKTGWQAGFPLGPILAPAFAGASLAKTGMLINSLKSGSKPSSGGGSVNAPSATAPTQQQAPQVNRTFNFNLTGDSINTSTVRSMFEMMNEQVGDGMTINTTGG